jgi:hypothetical protein
MQERTIDQVLPEYSDLLEKYRIQCPRMERIIGKGESCESAKEAARKECLEKGYAEAIFDAYPIEEGCGYADNTKEYWALFRCTD